MSDVTLAQIPLIYARSFLHSLVEQAYEAGQQHREPEWPQETQRPSYDDVAKAIQDLERSAISHFTAIVALLSANPEHPALREALQAAIQTSGEARSTLDFAEQALANYRLRLEASSGMSFASQYEPPPVPFREGTRFVGTPGEIEKFQNMFASEADGSVKYISDKPEKGGATTKTD